MAVAQQMQGQVRGKRNSRKTMLPAVDRAFAQPQEVGTLPAAEVQGLPTKVAKFLSSWLAQCRDFLEEGGLVLRRPSKLSPRRGMRGQAALPIALDFLFVVAKRLQPRG